MTDAPSFDALVIGAGAGGMFAAARLAHRGYRTLVVERLDRVGGRATTYDIGGFKVNEGAIVIELGGVTERTFADVGARFDIREPDPPILYRIGSKDVDVTGGGWGLLLSKLTRQGARLLSGLGAARNDDGLPDAGISTADWVRKYTRNESVHGIFQNMCGSIFAVGSAELPAKVFLTYFTRKSAFKRFGFCPQGTIGIWQSLADVVTGHGGQIWLGSEVSSLLIENGEVNGAVISRNGATEQAFCRFALSDAGPAATAGLVGAEHLPAHYREQVRAADRPCAMISVNFASRDRLVTAPGLLSFANTRRMCYVANFSEFCPEMAPDGWNLYVGTAVPQPAVGDFDEQAETDLLVQDLRDQIPGFDAARILSVKVTRDGWPPQRAVSGFDLPPQTPLPNLWNLGDGVKEYASGGTTACAETAQLVVEQVSAQFPHPATV